MAIPSVFDLLTYIGDAAQRSSDSRAPVDRDGQVELPEAALKRITDDLIELGRADTAPLKLSDIDEWLKALGQIGKNDDRDMVLEKLVVLMSRMPQDDKLSAALQQRVILALYADLPHPPSNYLTTLSHVSPSTSAKPGKNITYAARSPDGSGYNALYPNLGMANSPYARTVPSANTTPVSALPDSGLVFDTLMKRDKFRPHPGGVSALFFAFADLIIHSIFNTDHADYTINKASSYLDLSPLYGSNATEVEAVRRFDGKGSLKPDVFSDNRLLLMPPAVCALLVLFNRNHNYIAAKIYNINERRAYKDPASLSDEQKRAQDDEIFERSRLVNTGFFMQVILRDYVGAILGMARDRNTWRLDPLSGVRDLDHTVSPRGEGNVVSVEFNLMYRWHAALSEHDAEWTKGEFGKLFDGKDLGKVDINDFKNAAHKYFKAPGPVETWEFDGAKRNKDGLFNDADLAKLCLDSTASIAGAFGARGIPEPLRVVEILGIEQARSWGTCSMNEFRKFMGQKPFETFEEWNSDKEIHTAAAALYGDINNLELYVGLAAEEAKPAVPGAGLCPGYTISRSILADAVCLTRGDRYLTTDFTPFNLTSWGYQDCQTDKNDGSYGGLLTKLLFRTLPQYYPVDSAYAHFPFLQPDWLQAEWTKKGYADLLKQYTWKRPVPTPKPVVLTSAHDVKTVLENGDKFAPEFDKRINLLSGGVPLDRQVVSQALGSQQDKWKGVFGKEAERLVKEKPFSRAGSTTTRYLDAVKDVTNLAPMHVVARQIWGLPIKDVHHPRGTLPEQDAFNKFATVTRYMFNKSEPGAEWSLKVGAKKVFDEFTTCVKGNIRALQKQGFLEPVIPDKPHESYLKALLQCNGAKSNTPEGLNALATSLFAMTIPTTSFVAASAAHVINYYLDDSRKAERVELGRMYATGDLQAMLPFMWKALRDDPPRASYLRTAGEKYQLGDLVVQRGDPVLAIVGSETAPEAAQSKTGVRFDPLGWPEHSLFQTKLFEAMVAQISGPVFGLKNVRRAPGNSGVFDRVQNEESGVSEHRFVNSKGELLPYPTSLIVEFEV